MMSRDSRPPSEAVVVVNYFADPGKMVTTATAAESRKKQDAAVQPLPKMRSQQSFDEISRL